MPFTLYNQSFCLYVKNSCNAYTRSVVSCVEQLLLLTLSSHSCRAYTHYVCMTLCMCVYVCVSALWNKNHWTYRHQTWHVDSLCLSNKLWYVSVTFHGYLILRFYPTREIQKNLMNAKNVLQYANTDVTDIVELIWWLHRKMMIWLWLLMMMMKMRLMITQKQQKMMKNWPGSCRFVYICLYHHSAIRICISVVLSDSDILGCSNYGFAL